MIKNQKKIIWVLIIIFSFVFFTPLFAKEINIIYTGQTHAMLYHCNCPIEPDGGIARRATLIKNLRKKNPHTLVLDSGNFSAGGLMDEYTQNTQLDMQRTEINFKAMELMGYDAAAVGDDEFNFGTQFLLNNQAKTKLTLVSANIDLAGVLAYTIKELTGIKIGIIGLTNTYAKQKANNINFISPQDALEKTVKILKEKNTDLIILLSNLPEAESLGLIKEYSGINVLIVSNTARKEPYTQIGETIVLAPSWQGKKLGVLTLKLDKNKIKHYKVDLLRVSDKVKDDTSLQAILPACFSDFNCSKDNFRGSCINPATMDARCEFTKIKNKITLSVILPRNCLTCYTQPVIDYLKSRIPGLIISYLYYPDTKTTKLISELGINSLPVYLISKDIEKEKFFVELKQDLEAKADFYLLKPQISGVAYYLNRQVKKGSLDLFISLYDKNTITVLEAIKEFAPNVHFLAAQKNDKFDAARGVMETEEYLRCVCVKKYYPEKFWDYIICRTKNIASSWWDACLPGLDYLKIKDCAISSEGSDLLRENISLNKELEIIIGPTYLLDNQQIFATQGTPKKEDFKKIFKR